MREKPEDHQRPEEEERGSHPSAGESGAAVRFWDQAERIEMFASRDVDHRLEVLVVGFPNPARVRVLDLGCAGGRNTEFLAREGFDVWAVDFAPGMVRRTRRRVAQRLGKKEATRRVRRARMDQIPFLESGSIDLIVALGIYQQAGSEEEWNAALVETDRLLRTGGRCLVANFGPRLGPVGTPPERLEGSRFVYRGFSFGTACLLDRDQLDQEFARIGLYPEIATREVEKVADGKVRHTLNAFYRKR